MTLRISVTRKRVTIRSGLIRVTVNKPFRKIRWVAFIIALLLAAKSLPVEIHFHF